MKSLQNISQVLENNGSNFYFLVIILILYSWVPNKGLNNLEVGKEN